MVNQFFANFRKPEGWSGRFVAAGMNIGHSRISWWGLRHLAMKPADFVRRYRTHLDGGKDRKGVI